MPVGRTVMIQKIRILLEKYREIISYLFFGVLTTLVNFVVYLPVYNILGMSASVSNMIAWVAAVVFAYFVNKIFVFRSLDWSRKTVIPELIKFVSARLLSGVLETGILLVTVDILGWNGNIWKFVTQVLVVISNYVFSKLIVFRK